MSLNSSDRTCVTLALSAETISGNRSVMPPGWIPVPCRVLSPSAHASRMAWQFSRSG